MVLLCLIFCGAGVHGVPAEGEEYEGVLARRSGALRVRFSFYHTIVSCHHTKSSACNIIVH